MSKKPRARRTQTGDAPEKEGAASESAARTSTLVFISHDSRDAELAEAFANLLTDISAGTLKSFRSSDKKGVHGIAFGAEWYTTIMAQLDNATDVVALLTAQSTDRPWILYEAGVAKGKLDSTVFGIALGIPLERVSIGPFGQFQNSADDEDSLTKLCIQLLARNPEASPREEAVRRQVKIFRDEAAKILAVRGREPRDTPQESDQSAAKLFEEIKAMVRELPDQLRHLALRNEDLPRRHRLRPRMIMELASTTKDAGPAWLVFVSMLRETAPWLHDAGMEVYRVQQSQNPRSLERAKRDFRRLLEMSEHPALREYTRRDKDMHYLMRELTELAEPLMDRLQVNRVVGTTKPFRLEQAPASQKTE